MCRRDCSRSLRSDMLSRSCSRRLRAASRGLSLNPDWITRTKRWHLKRASAVGSSATLRRPALSGLSPGSLSMPAAATGAATGAARHAGPGADAGRAGGARRTAVRPAAAGPAATAAVPGSLGPLGAR
eukprot:scaffold12279_cov54-Phaeocystis_antarctica.AAC.1